MPEFQVNSHILSHGSCRPGKRGDQERPAQSVWAAMVVAGAAERLNPAHGARTKAQEAIGVTVLVRFVQRGRCRELPHGDVLHRTDDNVRRSGETSPTVKSSTVKGAEALTLKVRCRDGAES
jgi:hypothetical protein